jgi:predicted NUDIX family NTP pyrophosphohydrolase
VPKRSAGLLVYRKTARGLEVLLVHPGGPLWTRKDAGAWSIPKGEVEGDEDDVAVARREFREELGLPAPGGDWVDLGEVTQAGGKRVHAYTVAGEVDPESISSNTFSLEWPPRSGRIQEFPEVDRAEWFDLGVARQKLVRAQCAFVDRLSEVVSDRA